MTTTTTTTTKTRLRRAEHVYRNHDDRFDTRKKTGGVRP